jgi:hypothetical protein
MALESALIIPILLLCACLMVYGAIVLFERAQLQAASGYAAIRASLLWNGEQGGQAGEVGEAGEVGQAPQEGQAGEVGQSPKEGHAGEAGQAVQGGGLYRRTADTQADEKLGAAAGTAERYFGAISLPGFTEHGAEAASAGGPFGKTLSVSMEGDTRLPSRAVMGAFGMSSSRRSSGASKSLVPDFPEFIRNADLVVDIEEKLEDASPEFKAFADNFEAVAGKIRGFIGGLF